MANLDDDQHVFRHARSTAVDGDWVDPDIFVLKPKDTDGLSVDWVEYFGRATPAEAVPDVRAAHQKKGRTVRPASKFVLLNVGKTKTGTAQKCSLEFPVPMSASDPSHCFIIGYEIEDDVVAELISKTIVDIFPAGP